MRGKLQQPGNPHLVEDEDEEEEEEGEEEDEFLGLKPPRPSPPVLESSGGFWMAAVTAASGGGPPGLDGPPGPLGPMTGETGFISSQPSMAEFILPHHLQDMPPGPPLSPHSGQGYPPGLVDQPPPGVNVQEYPWMKEKKTTRKSSQQGVGGGGLRNPPKPAPGRVDRESINPPVTSCLMSKVLTSCSRSQHPFKINLCARSSMLQQMNNLPDVCSALLCLWVGSATAVSFNCNVTHIRSRLMKLHSQ
ncbi:hypothetical protein LSTR_LSTR008774 [Laodelphax striatellus]|uniref:Homeobox domain-containing protein n=1 Tax=Laodelphax striatellus TaxID=195883 RepID=A0A482XR63_LAOST|nr:hypothetical protein LSTR_LSTR008774 [Laodelphax striatellus]